MNKAGIIACSNGLQKQRQTDMELLKKVMRSMGIELIFGKYIFESERIYPGNGKLRAEELMKLYQNPEITDIFDVSGGDMANEVLEELDFGWIGKSGITFWGYSDLTTVLNAIYTMTGKQSVLYQIRHLTGKYGDVQKERFWNRSELFEINYQFLQGSDFEGILVGGNIRCFLKLSGTRYFPDMTGKILLLEAMGGEVPQMVTFLSQLKQLGVFEKINGIVLGTFSKMEEEGCEPTIEELVKAFAGKTLPIVKTKEIGHGSDAKAIIIGKEYKFVKKC
jgi:muramoyltetrapeptide carboxypeptidase LdcA involved in peptidoglycan recycling